MKLPDWIYGTIHNDILSKSFKVQGVFHVLAQLIFDSGNKSYFTKIVWR